MYASLSTWQLDDSIQEDSAYEAFVRDVLRKTLPTARDIGILDAVIVRTASDTIVAVSLYDSEDEADAAGQQTVDTFPELYDSKMKLVSRATGRADDMPTFLGELDC
jgi:hypothetical protein